MDGRGEQQGRCVGLPPWLGGTSHPAVPVPLGTSSSGLPSQSGSQRGTGRCGAVWVLGLMDRCCPWCWGSRVRAEAAGRVWLRMASAAAVTDVDCRKQQQLCLGRRSGFIVQMAREGDALMLLVISAVQEAPYLAGFVHSLRLGQPPLWH